MPRSTPKPLAPDDEMAEEIADDSSRAARSAPKKKKAKKKAARDDSSYSDGFESESTSKSARPQSAAPAAAPSLFGDMLSSKPLAKWSEAEAAVWLAQIGLARYRANFAHNHVTGGVLSRITMAKLKDDVGVSSLGHRELLMDELRGVKAKEKGEAKPPAPASERRELTVADRKEYETLSMEAVKHEIEAKVAAEAAKAAVERAKKAKRAVVDSQAKLKEFKARMTGERKEHALADYSSPADFLHCTFHPKISAMSSKFSEYKRLESGEGATELWQRVKAQEDDRLRDIAAKKQQFETEQGWETEESNKIKANKFFASQLKDTFTPQYKPRSDQVEQLLKSSRADGHISEKDLKECEKLQGDEMMMMAYVTLSVASFLKRYNREIDILKGKNGKAFMNKAGAAPPAEPELSRGPDGEVRKISPEALEAFFSRQEKYAAKHEAGSWETPKDASPAENAAQLERYLKGKENFEKRYYQDLRQRKLKMEEMMGTKAKQGV